MTNGEKLQSIFPNIEYNVKDKLVLTDIDNGAWFSLDWWNAEYKETTNKNGLSSGTRKNSEKLEKGTTKNDLAVDYISRQQEIDAFPDLLPNMGYSKKAITEILQKVPPTTPQEPKSEWEHNHEILKAYSDGVNEVLDKIRAEIWDLQYGEEEKSMTDENRADAYNNAIKQVIEIIDKYKGESEKQTDGNHENKKS